MCPEEAESGVEVVDDATQRRDVARGERRRRRRGTVGHVFHSSAVSIAAAVAAAVAVVVVVGQPGGLVAQDFTPAQLRVFQLGATEVSHLLTGMSPAADGPPLNKKGYSQPLSLLLCRL